MFQQKPATDEVDAILQSSDLPGRHKKVPSRLRTRHWRREAGRDDLVRVPSRLIL
jgi:hypothetical protein